MKQDASKQGQSPFTPPVSIFVGPIGELVGSRLLSPPTRPGLLASLARYDVLRVLGGGGMGVVVLARDSDSQKDVAIKLIKPELVSDQRIVHRFVKEAGHLQKLKHPNIVPVLEISDRQEGPYFVMPFFEGGSLAGRIRPGQPMEPDVILDIALQIAQGLAFAHERGIIHRDLKPANILLGPQTKSCLADFGLARTMFNDTLIDVEREQLEGTAPYMSPGVAAGHAEDTRCDIYAFGALLYEMLTGEPPYVGATTAEIRNQILAGSPKPISQRNPAADPGLVTVAEGAMARELRDRYANMTDVVADLQRIQSGKAPVGPRGLTEPVKRKPFSMWIPAGLVMIAVGLWLLWPPSQPDKAAKPPQPAPSVQKDIPQPEPRQPIIVKPVAPQPPPAPVVKLTNWQFAKLAGPPETEFKSPGGLAVDPGGAVYLTDIGDDTIRKIAPDGTVSTLAGLTGKSGSKDGMGSEARFMAPLGIALDLHNNLYVAEFASDLIRKISPDGNVRTLAGSAGVAGADNGPGDDAHFRNPWSVAADVFGNVFVADKDNNTIRQITPGGLVSTFAGMAGIAGSADGQGKYASFNAPHGVAVGSDGFLYVADTGNHIVRKISPAGLVTNLAGLAGHSGRADGLGKDARFSDVQSLAAGRAGDIFVLDGNSVRKITQKGAVTTLTNLFSSKDAPKAMQLSAIAVDKNGNLYLADAAGNAIWKVTPPPEAK